MLLERSLQAPSYGFRLKFYLPSGCSFFGDHSRRRLILRGGLGSIYLVRMPRPQRNRFGARETYCVLGKKFLSFEAAEITGRKLKQAISLFAAEQKIGLDVGKGKAGSSFSDLVKENIRASKGVHLRDDVHGLDVYPEGLHILAPTFEAYGFTTNVLSDYEARIAHYVNYPDLSPKEELALELYNESQFEGAINTRLIALITVVEILAEPKPRSKEATDFLNLLCGQVGAHPQLEAAEQTALRDGFLCLRRQSISQACREFVKAHASKEAATFFKACYSARSELIHSGTTKKLVPEMIDRLNNLVSELLLRSTNRAI